MRKFGIFLMTILCCTACSKEFLDKEPTNKIRESELLKTTEGVTSALMGCYSLMQDYSYYGRNFVILGDVYADNAKISSINVGYFSSFYNFSLTSTESYVKSLWLTMYAVVKAATNIIDVCKDENRTDISPSVLGEALAIRSLAYFDLVRTFAHKYSYDDSGIPLFNDTIQNPERTKVQQVYKLIINDLKEAEKLLTDVAVTPYRFNQRSVQALLTIVYMTNNQYTNAIEYGEKVLNCGEYSLLTAENYLESWTKESSSESIFSLAMSITDNTGVNSIGAMYSPEGYGGLVPTEDLLSLYSDSDVRTSFVMKRNEKFFIKFAGRDGVLGVDNVPIIRLSEICYILAECYILKASSNPAYFAQAQDLMTKLTQRVDPTISIGNLSDMDLYMKVYEEFRKEFAFEGKRFFQLKRSTFGINRTDCNSTVCSVPNPSYMFALPIPQAELDANKSLTQNKGYK